MFRSEDPDEPKIYFLPNLMTAMNLACGFFAVLSIFNGIMLATSQEGYNFAAAQPFYQRAILLIFASCIFDLLDGRLARLGGKESPFGAEFDSLADVISFGVAPAALAYGCGMQGGWDWVVLSYFVGCGVSRLARYNVTAEQLSEGADKVTHFEGTPIPTSIALVLMLVVAVDQERVGENLWFGSYQLLFWEFHPLVLAFAVSGSLMISKTLRIPKW